MRDPTPSRRRLLLGGLTAAIGSTAGCLGDRPLGGSDDGGSDDDDRVLTLTLADEGETLREGRVTDPTETDPRWDETAFGAVREGEPYTTQYRKPFFSTPDDPTYAVHEGTYYRLGSVVVDEAETTRPVLRLFDGDGSGGPEKAGGTDGTNGSTDDPAGDAADVVDADTLPAGDQRAVEIAHLAARARGNEGGVPNGLVQRGGYVYRDEAAVSASTLLEADGSERIRFRDTVYRIETARERFYEPVYRATGEPVAESSARMEAILRATLVGARLSPDGLSDDAREVLEETRYEEYAESHPFSTAYEEVLRELHERPFIDGNVTKDAFAGDRGRGLVRYGDRYYDYRLRFGSGDGGG